MAASIRSVRKVLMDDWDPIGIRGDIDAADEYDSYAMPLYQILRKHPSENVVLDYLNWMLGRMGLSSSKESVGHVVAKLLQIDVSADEPLE